MKCHFLENQAYIGITGEYRFCCVMSGPSTGETIHTHTPIEWLNSEPVSRAKEQFSQGIWPKECVRCQIDENNSGKSKRTEKEIIGPGLTHLDLRFGNSCNLKCVSCNPRSSSSINLESVDMLSKKITPFYQINKNNVLNWYDEKFFHYFENLPLIEVSLAGGEPMMMKYLPEFLERLDTSVKVRITTNGTINNPRLFNLLKKFDEVVMSISMDAIGKRIEYIRYGTNWEEIERNTLLYKDNFKTDIVPCFSVLNTLYYDEIQEWTEKRKIKMYDNNVLMDPEYLNLRHAPDSLKKQMTKFKSWQEQPADINVQQKFVEIITKLDSYRNIRIQEYLPEVAKAYGIN